MNNHVRSFLVFAAALPLAAFAQSSSSSGSSSPKGSSTNSSLHSPSSPSSSTSISMQVQHLDDSSAERLLTAKDLIGRDVYDRKGEKLGSIDDVVIETQATRQLASAMQTASSSSLAGSSGESSSSSVTGNGSTSGSSSSGLSGSSGSSPSGSPATSGSSGTPGTSGSMGSTGSLSSSSGSMDSSTSSQWSSSNANEPAVLVSTGGLFSRSSGKAKIAVSQLRFEGNRLTCDVTKDQIDEKSSTSGSSSGPR